MSWIDLLKELGGNAPARAESIAALERSIGHPLPKDYVAFLSVRDGGEGFVSGGDYAIFWRADEIPRFNQEYEVDVYAPGLLLIGSSGGGEGFGFDTRISPWTIIRVPFVGMELSLVEPVSPSFAGFIEALAKGETTS